MQLPVLAIICSLLLHHQASATLQPPQRPLQATPARRSSSPIAAAWFYMSDDQNYTTVPSFWSSINFSIADVLYIGPVGVQPDGTFNLYNSSETGPLSHRFNWVINRARSQNPDITLIASQWWGDGQNIWGSALDALQNSTVAIAKYASSVTTFVSEWGIDGYDVDYEANNVLDTTPRILNQVREAFDAGSGSYEITVSPSDTTYLGAAVSAINYVNMQTYAGGQGLEPSDFTALGFAYDQLLYGYCPEQGCSGPSLQEVEQTFNQYQQAGEMLAGIHTWRLNSGNYQYEDAQAAKVYEFLHG